MTQRVFDIKNEQDIQDLWSILPDWAQKIKKNKSDHQYAGIFAKNDAIAIDSCILNINWHDKTEITRPIQEATEQDIGKLCYFWDGDKNKKFIGIFRRKTLQGKYICDFNGWIFHHCRRLTKQEIKELC